MWFAASVTQLVDLVILAVRIHGCSIIRHGLRSVHRPWIDKVLFTPENGRRFVLVSSYATPLAEAVAVMCSAS
jgi:hypothetical protein